MKENQLKFRTREYFNKKYKNKGVIWFPAKVKWQETDIFSIWDGIYWIGNRFILFQITTIKNKSARLKKIANFMLLHNLYFSGRQVEGWLMCFRQKTKQFEIFKI